MYECGTFIVDSYVVGRINSIFREDSANCDTSMKFRTMVFYIIDKETNSWPPGILILSRWSPSFPNSVLFSLYSHKF